MVLPPTYNKINGEVEEIRLQEQALTETGIVTIRSGTVKLNHASTIIEATMAEAPKGGELLVVTNTSASGTAAHTVTLPSGVTFDGTNNTATLNAPGETLVLLALSPTQYLVLVNVGAVALSAV